MALLERVFIKEQFYQDKSVGRTDLDAMEKEVSIDIAELRRDLRSMSAEIRSLLATIIDQTDQKAYFNQENQKPETPTTNTDTENNISVNRHGSRHRKKSILNEASYLAHRLSRALSSSQVLTEEDKEDAEKEDLSKLIMEKDNTGKSSGNKDGK